MKYVNILFVMIIALAFAKCNPSPTEQSNPKTKTITSEVKLDRSMANQLSQLAFHCIDTEYPNKLGQVIGSAADLKTPKELRPAFYGCFDWHSAVHGHWTLVKLLKTFPTLNNANSIRAKIANNLTPENIATELEFWEGPHNKSFERTYGWAWLLKLQQELDSWEDDQGQYWAETLQPLSSFLLEKYKEFLPRLNYPIRVGEHTNTAFGLTFAVDYAHTLTDQSFLDFLRNRSNEYYVNDTNCPLNWEPSGYDFLSPCLEEAHLMSKVMDATLFASWWSSFVKQDEIMKLKPATSLDLTDGKLVHLVGLNFSRAWCLYDIAKKLDHQELIKIADAHILSSIDNVINGDYAGEHWLATFAVMAMSAANN